jgi:hypothetical protein
MVMGLSLLVLMGVVKIALTTLAGLMGLVVSALMIWFTLYLMHKVVTFVVPGFFRNIANIFSWIFTETPVAAKKAGKAFKRAAGIDEASVVADFLAPYRTEKEEVFIGDPYDWAENLLGLVRQSQTGSGKTNSKVRKKGLKHKIREAIRARDMLLLQLRSSGDTERLNELVTGMAQTMQKLISLYMDLKPVVKNLKAQRATLDRLNGKIRKYETQLLREQDPSVEKSLRSAIRSCLESIEVLRTNRRRIKVFSIRVETATTKLENLAVMCLDSNESETSHVLDELDDLTAEIASSRRAFSEALEEIDQNSRASSMRASEDSEVLVEEKFLQN